MIERDPKMGTGARTTSGVSSVEEIAQTVIFDRTLSRTRLVALSILVCFFMPSHRSLIDNLFRCIRTPRGPLSL